MELAESEELDFMLRVRATSYLQTDYRYTFKGHSRSLYVKLRNVRSVAEAVSWRSHNPFDHLGAESDSLESSGPPWRPAGCRQLREAARRTQSFRTCSGPAGAAARPIQNRQRTGPNGKALRGPEHERSVPAAPRPFFRGKLRK